MAHHLRQESVQTQNVNLLLFEDKQLLQLPTSVYAQLPTIGQNAITAAAACLWDSLLDVLSRVGDDNVKADDDPLETVLKTALETVRHGNQTVKAHLRQYLLESDAFHDPQVLERVSKMKGGHAADLGLVGDAALRARNMKMRVSVPQ